MKQIVSSLMQAGSVMPVFGILNARYALKCRMWLDELVLNAKLEKLNTDAFQSTWSSLNDLSKEKLLLRPEVCSCLRKIQTAKNLISSELSGCMGILEAIAGNLKSGDSIKENVMEDKVVFDGFEIDFWSERSRQVQDGSAVCCRPAVQITKDERIEILRALSGALHGIRTLSASFYELVKTYARVIVIRNSDEGGGASEQVSDKIGEIRILNAMSYSHHSLMNAIIHESVHSFLGTFECVEFTFTNESVARDENLKPVSLWSGRMLSPQAFIHAIFVYFALIHFVRLEISNSQEVNAREDLSRELMGLMNGFLYPGKISQYVSYACTIDNRVVQCLDYMQEIVRAECNHLTI